jgi:hypothetical protein
MHTTPSTAEPHFHVIFRACDVVLAVNKAARPWNLDKRSLIQICFKSLYEALKPVSHSISVLGDKISPELTAFFEQHDVKLIHGDFGNQESIRQTLALADAVPDTDTDWIYFCEDDYLHVPHAFEWIRDFILNRHVSMKHKPRLHSLASLIDLAKADLVIFPPDYPDRYGGKYRRFSLVFHAGLSHWRQVTDTTFTFLLQGRTFRKYRHVLMKASTGANDRYLSRKLYGRWHFLNKALCVSPMPSLSTHMHGNVMSPLVDWQAVAEHNRVACGLPEAIT